MKNTVLAMFSVGVMAAPILIGAAPQAPAAPPQFEVASIKPNVSPAAKGAIQPPSGGRFTATNVTLALVRSC